MTGQIRIHLADDHQVLIDGMRTLLNTVKNFEVIGFSLDGSTVYDDVISNKATVLVLDISMPVKDGIEVIKEFAKKGYPCKVIILSSYDDLKIIQEVMKLGVSGYLTKQCAGEDYFCKTVREKIFNTATKDDSKLNKHDPITNSTLTGRETEVIILIALEYSGKEISEKLFISTNTVETHRKNIMKKLNAKNSITLVKFAINNKLITS
jgi:DNA-binding NarL/FixJ family response regulator